MKAGWKAYHLGSICDFQGGSQPPKGEWIKTPKEGYVRMLQIRDFTKSRDFDIEYVKKSSKLRLCKEDDILIGRYGASVGKILTGLAGAYNVAIIRTIPDESIVIKPFIRRVFEAPGFQELLRKASTQRTAQAGFSKEDIADYEISLPPLPEQQRIVDILDQEFAKIDGLKANAEKALQAAKDLFISTLSKELKHREGWKETRIGDFCEIIRGKRFVRADIVEVGVPCIHYGDIYTHYGLFATKAKGCVSPDLAKKLRFASKNDVIVVAAGENRMDIGVGVAWLGEEPAVVHDACFILKHSQNPMFLSYFFRSAEYHDYLKDEVNEGKICSFLTKPLAEAKISLPPLDEQEQIVNRLGIVYTNCKALQENYQRTLSLCDDLKCGLLRKAFNGEL